MSLLNYELSIWEVSFRWAGYDPDKFYYRIPLAVRDNFRLLIDQIYAGQLDCYSLSLKKYLGDDPYEAKFYIRYWLPLIEDCSSGINFDRRLLKWAMIDRESLYTWCNRYKAPLPEFWFPAGWNIDYEWPSDDPEEEKETQTGESPQDKKIRLNERHRTEMACKQIALKIWEKHPTLSIKEMANRDEIQTLGGGEQYEIETVQGWVSQVDPRNPSSKRGRKRKNNSTLENPDQA